MALYDIYYGRCHKMYPNNTNQYTKHIFFYNKNYCRNLILVRNSTNWISIKWSHILHVAYIPKTVCKPKITDRQTYTSKSLESPTKYMLVYIHAVICMPVMKSTYYTTKILNNFTLNYSGLKITE